MQELIDYLTLLRDGAIAAIIGDFLAAFAIICAACAWVAVNDLTKEVRALRAQLGAGPVLPTRPVPQAVRPPGW